MFKNRAFQVQLVKRNDNVAAEQEAELRMRQLNHVTNVVRENAKTVAFYVGGAIVVNKLLNTACQIAVVTVKANLR